MEKMTIGDALFTKTQQRVLSLLYGKPDQSFYLNEVVRIAGVGKGAVSRELLKLVNAGLLTISKQGNQNHYQANANNPIFNELKQIVQKSFGVVDVIKASLSTLLPQLEMAFIYGSIAKDSEHAGSDIDVMLVGKKLSYGEVMELLDNAEQQLARTINPTLLTPEEFEKRITTGQSFLTRVMEQPKLWIKESSL
jgi:predicted nucleotidyltransferase